MSHQWARACLNLDCILLYLRECEGPQLGTTIPLVLSDVKLKSIILQALQQLHGTVRWIIYLTSIWYVTKKSVTEFKFLLNTSMGRVGDRYPEGASSMTSTNTFVPVINQNVLDIPLINGLSQKYNGKQMQFSKIYNVYWELNGWHLFKNGESSDPRFQMTP